MPAKSVKQQKFMAGCANNPKNMKGKCPPKPVAQEFSKKRGDPMIGQKKKKEARSVAIGRGIMKQM